MSNSSARPVGAHFDGDLRQALLDAAAAHLDAAGIDALSLRDVARRVGVSHAAPAHHFGDKTGLLTALATEGFSRFVAHLAPVLAATSALPAPNGLARLGRAYAEFAERHPGYFAVMFRPGAIHDDDPDFVAASTLAFEALVDHVAGYQQAGWHASDDSRELAAAAWSLAHGIAVLRAHGSLARHYPDTTLDGAATIVATLLG